MPTTTDTLAGYIKRYGWASEEHGEGLLVTGFRGSSGVFRIFVQLVKPWVTLVIMPFVPRPVPACRERFYRYVLRLNFDMNLTKIGADPDEDIALSVELPGQDVRYDDFSTALDILAYYANTYYPVLLSLARDPNYVPPAKLDGTAG